MSMKSAPEPMAAQGDLSGHTRLMDSVYGSTRHVYDATRKFYLFGRDTLIRELNLKPGESLCEVGCGTGRNLIHIARAWPGSRLYGLDASTEMLKTAEASVTRAGASIQLRHGFAETFNDSLFDGAPAAGFDAVVFPYSLSMIPDWQGALANAMDQLAPGGRLRIVDFGQMTAWPGLLRTPFQAFLAAFHVTPRPGMEMILRAHPDCADVTSRPIGGGYAQLIRAVKRGSSAGFRLFNL